MFSQIPYDFSLWRKSGNDGNVRFSKANNATNSKQEDKLKKFFSKIGQCMGHDVDKISVLLDINIDNIKQSHPHNAERWGYEVLVRWSKKQPEYGKDSQAMMNRLEVKLKEAERNDLANKVVRFVRGLNDSSPEANASTSDTDAAQREPPENTNGGPPGTPIDNHTESAGFGVVNLSYLQAARSLSSEGSDTDEVQQEPPQDTNIDSPS
ncbi:unnamed protein product [Owenia fusiformis]|uniref:Death domain-containing protein n=1 Tax=Owenia fusiformis TaxID=6347 RepID=A0A8S4Q3S1_OWEFU|nr:unnamed protein product [Owenia fusiformis]